MYPLVEFWNLAFTRMPGESYWRRCRPLFLCSCDVFLAIIMSLLRWFYTRVLGLTVFQITLLFSMNCSNSVFIQFCQFRSIWHLRNRKSPYALHPISQKFSQCCLSNSSNVRLIDDDPLSSFQGRSSSASSFNTSLLQAIDSVMSLALCPQLVSQAPLYFFSFRDGTTVVVAFPASLSAQSSI